MQPQIVTIDIGRHNADLEVARGRLEKSKTYQDLSTVIVCPTRGNIHAKVVQSWMGLMRPMNQKVIGPLFAIGMEVGEAYNQMVSMILNNPDLSTWKYMLTIEEDNMPPPDGLLKLYESMDRFDVVGGLYWTKGEGGQPMIYGDPKVMPKSFMPQMPQIDTVQEANGLGMGFNLFKIEMFKKMPGPWFKTMQEYTPGVGAKIMTQDLYFYEEAAKLGFRFACDNRVKVGHYDFASDIIW
jgi:hypothetical protein